MGINDIRLNHIKVRDQMLAIPIILPDTYHIRWSVPGSWDLGQWSHSVRALISEANPAASLQSVA